MAMYYIYDLASQNVRASAGSRLALLCAWARATGTAHIFRRDTSPLDFSELNITGNDTRRYVSDLSWGPNSGGCYPIRDTCIRRFQVLDGEGRSVDIRTWKAEIAQYHDGVRPARKRKSEHIPEFRREPCGWGRKHHGHRIGSPAFTRDNLMGLEGMADIPEDIRPIVDRTRPRNRGLNRFNAWDAAEVKDAGKYGRRCWKDSSRAARQWAKHKDGCSGRDLRKGQADFAEMAGFPETTKDCADLAPYMCDDEAEAV